MKLKIKIAGPKVHDVGYRVFLLKHAMNMALPGLSTYNWDEDGQQEVIALVEGDEARIKAFLKAIEKSKPELAEVSKITSEPFDGEVGRTSEVAMFCSFVQLDKAIPLLLDMRDDLKAVRKNTDMIPQMSEDIKEMKGDIKAVRKNTDMIPEMSEDLKEMKGDIKEMKGDIKEMKGDIKAVRKTTGATFEEIKAQREEIQPVYGMSMQQVRADIRAIKERLGML
ncbi:MAG: Acylphosphatase [Methanosaeta sp. PtaU1.Bin112]|nr:MAG: Acylphosphatase [Methanosaeta sp. PtaU1.Bin112]